MQRTDRTSATNDKISTTIVELSQHFKTSMVKLAWSTEQPSMPLMDKIRAKYTPHSHYVKNVNYKM